jgi:SEFIR domain
VRALADDLRGHGIDCVIDQYVESPPEGWPRWMTNQIIDAQFVLLVCTETYELRALGREQRGLGRGVSWEGAIVTQDLYEGASAGKFVPVVFSEHDRQHVPIWLRGATCYALTSSEGYERLYRRLTDQPLVVAPPVGERVVLPPAGGAPPAWAGRTPVTAPDTREPIAPRLEDGAAGVQMKLARAGLLVDGEGVVAVATAKTQVRKPGWSEAGVSFPTLIVITNVRILWWFLPNPGQADPQRVWWLSYDQIDGVRHTNLRIDPFRPKFIVSHRLPTEPRKVSSWEVRPAETADVMATYVRDRLR